RRRHDAPRHPGRPCGRPRPRRRARAPRAGRRLHRHEHHRARRRARDRRALRRGGARRARRARVRRGGRCPRGHAVDHGRRPRRRRRALAGPARRDGHHRRPRRRRRVRADGQGRQPARRRHAPAGAGRGGRLPRGARRRRRHRPVGHRPRPRRQHRHRPQGRERAGRRLRPRVPARAAPQGPRHRRGRRQGARCGAARDRAGRPARAVARAARRRRPGPLGARRARPRAQRLRRRPDGGAMTVTAQAADTAPAPRPGWWDEPFGVFQTNLREIDADLDVEAALDAIEEHGAGVWLLNVGGILSHYPTDLPFQTRNPHLARRAGGDLVGDALAAARRRGVRLLARMDFSKVAPAIADAHPEWLYVSPTGERQEFEGLVSVCPSAGYYQHRLLDVVDEVLDRYEVDGFFFNWFGFNEVDYAGRVHGVCHCAACQEGFSARTGLDRLPDRAGDEHYRAWRGYATATIDTLTARVRAHVAARRPDAALILGTAADVLFHEANNAIGRTLWPYATGEAVSALRSARPGKPVLVNAVAFWAMPYRFAAEQPEMLGQYLTQAIARGANPSTYVMGPTGRVAYDGLPAAAAVTRFHRDHRDVYTGLAPAARVGLVRPDPLDDDGRFGTG